MTDLVHLMFMPRRQLHLFSKLPLELVLYVKEYLTITDKLSLADTCSTYRSLISDAECTRVCTMAGLSIPPDVTPREMAKLLCRPRVGVCNWSYEDGVPKSGLDDFSKVISISSAIREKVPVALHPVFEPSLMLLRETSAFEMVQLRVAKDEPELLLIQHRLYIHEYATSPPLDELHVMIREDEGPIYDGDVAFRIRNPKGVTLGNYYQGLFRFLRSAPSPKMPLTEQVIADNPSYGCADNSNAKLHFESSCPTNLAMLDVWYEAHKENVLFSEKGLTCNLPLYKGALTLVIYPDDPDILEDLDFIAECDGDIKWGEPHREPEKIYFQPVSNEELWKDEAPLIMF